VTTIALMRRDSTAALHVCPIIFSHAATWAVA
jgi:hypothetical protein